MGKSALDQCILKNEQNFSSREEHRGLHKEGAEIFLHMDQRKMFVIGRSLFRI